MPRLETIEAIMKLSQMVVQGLWDIKSPMLQLPHVSDEMLRYFNSKKVQGFIFSSLHNESLVFFSEECENDSRPCQVEG